MKTRFLLALPFLLCLGMVALGDDKADKADLESGSWKVTAMNQAEKDVPADMLAQAKLVFTFKDDKLTVASAGESKTGAYKVDATKTPKEVDLKMEDKNEKVDKAIYEINKDMLKIAIGVKDRPKDFKGGKDVVVFTLERQK
jgi:uncharacterized protein (TIGR03067 family)